MPWEIAEMTTKKTRYAALIAAFLPAVVPTLAAAGIAVSRVIGESKTRVSVDD
jgi:hypothetical protein